MKLVISLSLSLSLSLSPLPLSPEQVDYYRMCVLPMLKKILPDNGLELKVLYYTYSITILLIKLYTIEFLHSIQKYKTNSYQYCPKLY